MDIHFISWCLPLPLIHPCIRRHALYPTPCLPDLAVGELQRGPTLNFVNDGPVHSVQLAQGEKKVRGFSLHRVLGAAVAPPIGTAVGTELPRPRGLDAHRQTFPEVGLRSTG